MTKFSNEFKESLVKKMIREPKRSIAKEAHVAVSSLHKWVRDEKVKAFGINRMASDPTSESSMNWTSAKLSIFVLH
jgi:transposase-like protein